MEYFSKFKGLSKPVPPRPDLKQLAFVWVGGFLAISVVGMLATYTHQALILGSFGASCFILFILPDSPFAQPRNTIGGHVVSTLVGLVFFHWVSTEWWSMALALGTALSAMQLLRVNHPPAGSNPIIVFIAAAGWEFLIMPTLVGSVILVLIALFYNNLSKERSYPLYWV
ncbi:MAG: HPP family protein [Pseudomonadota bacterium]|nr:HPP family protein [Pseudomonadota bacterium]